MGANIKQLRTRIKSVDSTLHLTKAMGLVASSKIRRATDSMQKGQAYASAFKETVSLLTSYDECKKTPYMAARGDERICLVVIAGDRGLAGGYNANIFRLLREYPNARIIPIGKRACERFDESANYAEHYSYADAIALANKICEEFVKGEFDKFGIMCTKYVSLMSQDAYVQWVLPLTASETDSNNTAVFEPDALTVLNSVVPDFVASMIISCVKESFACEVAARRVAMDNAEKNAREMIDNLELEYNRARQGAITQEITEIVAGSGI